MHRLTSALKRTVPFLVALAVGLVALAAAAPSGQVLVVEDARTGEHYVTEPVEDGTVVGLEYTHSVEKSRVYDVYRVEGDTLVNTRMEFESYGWGLPARVDVTNVDGTFVYEPAEPIAELRTLPVSPGRVAGHELRIGNATYDLVATANGRDVRIHVERRSPILAI